MENVLWGYVMAKYNFLEMGSTAAVVTSHDIVWIETFLIFSIVTSYGRRTILHRSGQHYESFECQIEFMVIDEYMMSEMSLKRFKTVTQVNLLR